METAQWKATAESLQEGRLANGNRWGNQLWRCPSCSRWEGQRKICLRLHKRSGSATCSDLAGILGLTNEGGVVARVGGRIYITCTVRSHEPALTSYGAISAQADESQGLLVGNVTSWFSVRNDFSRICNFCTDAGLY